MRARWRTVLLLLGTIVLGWAGGAVAPGPVSAAPARAGTASPSLSDDNADSIAIVIGNRNYRQTTTVDYALNDAKAIQHFLTGSLGFRAENVFVLNDATLSEMNQALGSDSNPQAGRLWRSVKPGRSNVFVFYSGHGVPDLASRQPFLLPQDGDPNQIDSGYQLQTLYRNLDLVKQKVGDKRQVVVMIDACFTGETGRKGESLLAVSAPGFQPALPKAANGVVRVVATSGASPANWDNRNNLGLFTSRFLMGAAGLAGKELAGKGLAGGDAPAGATGREAQGAINWAELRAYMVASVRDQSLRDTGREQIPEIDDASLSLAVRPPVPDVANAVAAAIDDAQWRLAESDGSRKALEDYVGRCGRLCQHRDKALALLMEQRKGNDAAQDVENWRRLSARSQYKEYLASCGSVCAFRAVAQTYLGSSGTDASPKDEQVAECDARAADPQDPDRPTNVAGVRFARIDALRAIAVCRSAAAAQPELRRLQYQLGRALDKTERYKEAVTAYRAASDAGSLSARNNLGTLYENGQGVRRSLPDAFRVYLDAANAGNPVAMTNAARMLEYGRGAPKDAREARRWYEKAMAAGDSSAMLKMAGFHIDGGGGLPRDPAKGFALFRKAADAGDPVAMAAMATLIDNGFGAFFPGRRAVDTVMGALRSGEAGAAAVAATDMSANRLKPETIRTVQTTLRRQQYYSGELDGRFNPVFVRALDAYARSQAEQGDDASR